MVAASKMRVAQASTEKSRDITEPLVTLLGDLPGAKDKLYQLLSTLFITWRNLEVLQLLMWRGMWPLLSHLTRACAVASTPPYPRLRVEPPRPLEEVCGLCIVVHLDCIRLGQVTDYPCLQNPFILYRRGPVAFYWHLLAGSLLNSMKYSQSPDSFHDITPCSRCSLNHICLYADISLLADCMALVNSLSGLAWLLDV